MLGHFEESAGSTPAAVADVTAAEPVIAHASGDSGGNTGSRGGAIPTSRARAFTAEDLLDYEEWTTSGGFS
ncbi:hypothetical protein F1C58_07120 [Glaciihabitans sp. INWT7]|uniref:hypothetical protein n=1 Tax=Glaciihabitans sp. INWT7 TaxID=2596912 RepID=UPI001624AF73|nr:hypothetical protein [Glaciihabitans sp. INWT7]QNE46696.1 hypothetical protein F1C58_07120 [Glaciihabitans sp. INWT7]